VDAENVADFAVEVDPATLNLWAEKGALTDFPHNPDPSNTVGLNEASDADVITNLQLKHPEIIPCPRLPEEDLFLRIVNIVI
jgi:hypothetical protein